MAFALNTERLRLREFTAADAPYLLRQLNEPSFIENIADRGVRTLDQAGTYLEAGPMASYRQHGFGFWAVTGQSSGEILGMCGLVKRDTLPEPDLGYAFLPEHVGQGYALEACRASLRAARDIFHLPALTAIVNDGNTASRRLLEKLGFGFQGMTALMPDTPELCLYRIELTEHTAC